jgi:molybdenum cofactor cytidylyltransferase
MNGNAGMAREGRPREQPGVPRRPATVPPYGSPRAVASKLLVPLPDGTPIALAAARRLRPAVDECVAVLRRADSELAALLAREGLRVVECAQAVEGMGASLACGVRSAADADAWLIALADMPFIATDTVRRVALAVRAGAELAAPFYAGRRGHPVGVGRRFRAELAALRGDQGARELFAQHSATVVRVACDDPSVLRDVDTPMDLAPGRAVH